MEWTEGEANTHSWRGQTYIDKEGVESADDDRVEAVEKTEKEKERKRASERGGKPAVAQSEAG